MAEIPPVNTDEWATYMIDTITNGGKIRDEDYAALSGVQTKQVRRVVFALVTSFNGDDGGGGGGGVTKAYVDQRDDAIQIDVANDLLYMRQQYTEADSKTLTDAKAYADSIMPAEGVSAAYVGTAVANGVDDANEYTDAAAQSTLQLAKEYTDDKAGTGGVSQAYVDESVSAASTANRNYTDTTATETRADAAAYTDDVAETLSSGVAAMVDSKLSDSGWISDTPVSGYQGNSVVHHRKDRTRVSLRGYIRNDTLTNLAALSGVMTLPEGSRPTRECGFALPGAEGKVVNITVKANGGIDILAPAVATSIVKLDGVTFYTD